MEVEDVHDLFDDGEDDRGGGYGSDEAIEDNRYDGAAGARLELGGSGDVGEGGAEEGGEGAKEGEEGKGVVKPKRVIKNPQPKLNPDRITGQRGVIQLENVFKDFKPKGPGHEFEDLDRVMKGMEHWAHRLYPKLPFDDVMKRISVLGKKMQVTTYMRKLRLDMVHEMNIKSAELVNSDNEDDQTKRYEDGDIPRGDSPGPGMTEESNEEAFERMMAMVEEDEEERSAAVQTQPTPPQPTTPSTPRTMTDEQKERMARNRALAEERRRQKKLEKSLMENTATTADIEPQVQSQPENTVTEETMDES